MVEGRKHVDLSRFHGELAVYAESAMLCTWFMVVTPSEFCFKVLNEERTNKH